MDACEVRYCANHCSLATGVTCIDIRSSACAGVRGGRWCAQIVQLSLGRRRVHRAATAAHSGYRVDRAQAP